MFTQKDEQDAVRYAEMIYRIAFHHTRNREDAEDIMQTVLLKFWQDARSFDKEEDCKRFLIRMTVNECHSLFRSAWKKRKSEIPEYEWEQLMSYEQSAEESALAQKCSALYYAVMSLPDRYRSSVYLYYYEEYSVKEIAQILEQKETTIQTRLMRARKILQKRLKGEFGNE